MQCRVCGQPCGAPFLDLGTAPPSNALLRAEDLDRPETYFPLRLSFCPACRLAQSEVDPGREMLFGPAYPYHSSVSSSWLGHARRHVEEAVARLALDASSLVLEVASNDGYLLQFVQARGIPCVGVEPTAGTAQAARARGIETIERFFGLAYAREFLAERRPADLVVANNVLAHVPDPNDFVAGLAHVLAREGSASIEFPHLQRLVAENQFDTVYHEHYSYFSLHAAQALLQRHGLRTWSVERLPTHGGSLRVWACHRASGRAVDASVAALLADERASGIDDPAYLAGFQRDAERVKDDLLGFLLACRRDGKRVLGYGAAAKGNTLLNFAGARRDLVECVVDASRFKQGLFLPGSRIPIVAEDAIRALRPPYILVLPWNLIGEIGEQLRYCQEWGATLVTALPRLAFSPAAELRSSDRAPPSEPSA